MVECGYCGYCGFPLPPTREEKVVLIRQNPNETREVYKTHGIQRGERMQQTRKTRETRIGTAP